MSKISLQTVKDFQTERFTKRILFQHNGVGSRLRCISCQDNNSLSINILDRMCWFL
ncbi:hypothetical protein [Paenibacillus sp. ACRRY]|uniref:hypothetical protein n=1 Tax=Paenibacillus sp. ACRRY TaxID=2918208 RepID=UPI001EF6F2BE|nr:hypothetical protein [Paenibacillus sp. ACRRY]MCG7385953.1 hypothetical protein [Paenibacillus sp. ACRRY]